VAVDCGAIAFGWHLRVEHFLREDIRITVNSIVHTHDASFLCDKPKDGLMHVAGDGLTIASRWNCVAAARRGRMERGSNRSETAEHGWSQRSTTGAAIARQAVAR
jgi:hypothetical protein